MTRDKGTVFKGLGWTLQRIGQLAQATDAYEQAWPSVVAPDRRTLLAKVQTLRARENADRVEALQKKLNRKPHSVELQRRLVRVFIDQGDPVNAIAAAEALRRQGDLDVTTRLGTAKPGTDWQSFAQIFDAAYRTLTALSRKPLMIAETACNETGGDKAAWIQQAFTDLQTTYTRIRMLVWFDINKECNWTLRTAAPSTNPDGCSQQTVI